MTGEVTKLKEQLEKEKSTTNWKLQKLKDHLKAKYMKTYEEQKQGHRKIEDGLEIAYGWLLFC